MIKENIILLKDRVKEERDISFRMHDMERNDKIIQELRIMYKDISRIIKCLETLKKFGEDELIRNDLRDFFFQLKALKKIDGTQERNHQLIHLKGKVSSINDQINKTWSSKVNKDYEDLIKVGKILDRVFNANQFYEINSYKQNSIAHIPESDVTVKKYKEDLEKFTKIIKTYALDKKTSEFIGDLATGKAYLNDLDDEVLVWLRKNQLLTKIKLMIEI